MSERVALAAFEAAYREQFTFAWRALRRLGVPERDLADATQDAFVVAFRKFGEFDSARPLRSWIYAICLRVASNWRRSARARHEILAEPGESGEAPQATLATESERAKTAEQRALLEAALSAMPLDQRAVFCAFELEGMSGDEIASALEVPLGTVHSRLRLARENFRRTIDRVRARDRFALRRAGGDR